MGFCFYPSFSVEYHRLLTRIDLTGHIGTVHARRFGEAFAADKIFANEIDYY